MKHCCKEMEFFIREGSVDILYEPMFRGYSIGMKNGTSAQQTIHFCPWCGSKLSMNLRDKWFEVLWEAYDLEFPLEAKERIPAEFKTDEWWKKRGL